MASFLVMGAGAVGGFYAARLAEAGHEVSLVARGAHLEALRQDGLRVESVFGTFHHRLPADEDPVAFGKQFDYILFAVKSFDTEAAAQRIRPTVGAKTQILALQNGIENVEILRSHFGEHRVIRAFCRVNAEITEPGKILQQKFGQIVMGEDNGAKSDRIQSLARILDSAGIDHSIPDDIRRAVWIKFSWNSVQNVLTGLLQKTVVELYADEAMLSLMRRMTTEILSVAHAEGVDLRQEDMDEVVEEGMKLGAFRTSTFQDREKGKPLEFDAFTGALVRYSRKHDIDVPVYETLHALYRGLGQ